MTTLCLDDLKKPYKKPNSGAVKCLVSGCTALIHHKSQKCAEHRIVRCRATDCKTSFKWSGQEEVYCTPCRDSKRKTREKFADD